MKTTKAVKYALALLPTLAATAVALDVYAFEAEAHLTPGTAGAPLTISDTANWATPATGVVTNSAATARTWVVPLLSTNRIGSSVPVSGFEFTGFCDGVAGQNSSVQVLVGSTAGTIVGVTGTTSAVCVNNASTFLGFIDAPDGGVYSLLAKFVLPSGGRARSVLTNFLTNLGGPRTARRPSVGAP